MSINPLRNKPQRPAVPVKHVRTPLAPFDPALAAQMGAFTEDALDLADAREARDRAEEPRHG